MTPDTYYTLEERSGRSYTVRVPHDDDLAAMDAACRQGASRASLVVLRKATPEEIESYRKWFE